MTDISEITLEICTLCKRPKKWIDLLCKKVQYCPCDDTKNALPSGRASQAEPKQLELFPDWDWGKLLDDDQD